MLYAGRMNELKNPVFVVDVLAQLKKRDDVYAVFIGQGDEQVAVNNKAEQLGITDRIRITGWHNNVPLVMKASDVFVFPRKPYPKEGLGLVVVEAQAAGLPMFLTEGIVQDAIVIEELAHVNDLSDPSAWADQIAQVLDSGAPVSRKAALEKMMQSPFELSTATKNLVDIYERRG
jgi:glycosyltransferase involved in cell wall biosynthesis